MVLRTHQALEVIICRNVHRRLHRCLSILAMAQLAGVCQVTMSVDAPSTPEATGESLRCTRRCSRTRLLRGGMLRGCRPL